MKKCNHWEVYKDEEEFNQVPLFNIEFLEIGTDKDHAHFLVQSVPSYSPTKIITIIKSLTAREVFARGPSVKKQLWGGKFWTDGNKQRA